MGEMIVVGGSWGVTTAMGGRGQRDTSNGGAAQINGRKEEMGERKEDFFSHHGLNLATLVLKKHEYSYMCKKYIYLCTDSYIYINI